MLGCEKHATQPTLLLILNINRPHKRARGAEGAIRPKLLDLKVRSGIGKIGFVQQVIDIQLRRDPGLADFKAVTGHQAYQGIAGGFKGIAQH